MLNIKIYFVSYKAYIGIESVKIIRTSDNS